MFSTNCAPFYSFGSIKCEGLEKGVDTDAPGSRGRDRPEGPQESLLGTCLLFRLRTMQAAATTDPWDQELELGTARGGNCLFLILGLSSFHRSLAASPNVLSPKLSSALHWSPRCLLTRCGHAASVLHLAPRPVLRRGVVCVCACLVGEGF